jgi:aspartyl-tRNA(Asn)/glutamyl-tRNA(Gln) amidotransferase subunit C
LIKNKKIDIEHVAKLANLRFSAREKGIIENQLNDILSHVEKLNELDTSAIEPASHVIPVKNVFRADALSPSLSLEDSLGGSPDKEDRFFKVPKIIGG